MRIYLTWIGLDELDILSTTNETFAHYACFTGLLRIFCCLKTCEYYDANTITTNTFFAVLTTLYQARTIWFILDF